MLILSRLCFNNRLARNTSDTILLKKVYRMKMIKTVVINY